MMKRMGVSFLDRSRWRAGSPPPVPATFDRAADRQAPWIFLSAVEQRVAFCLTIRRGDGIIGWFGTRGLLSRPAQGVRGGPDPPARAGGRGGGGRGAGS